MNATDYPQLHATIADAPREVQARREERRREASRSDWVITGLVLFLIFAIPAGVVFLIATGLGAMGVSPLAIAMLGLWLCILSK